MGFLPAKPITRTTTDSTQQIAPMPLLVEQVDNPLFAAGGVKMLRGVLSGSSVEFLDDLTVAGTETIAEITAPRRPKSNVR